MSRVSIAIVFAITLALAGQAAAATCAAVSADNADPPANGVEYATWQAAGVRRWDCKAGALVDPKQILGEANFTSADGWKGNFTYIDKVARFTQTDSQGVTTVFDLDATPGLTPVPGALANARWTVNWVDGQAPADLVPGEQYLVRTDSVGGETPTKCPSTKSNRVEVPYTTTYVLYNCADGATPASSAVSRSAVGAVATAAIAAAAALF